MTIIKQFSYVELAEIANIEEKLKEILEKKNIDINYNELTEHEVQLILQLVINYHIKKYITC